jgi:OTU-like cysteine protease
MVKHRDYGILEGPVTRSKTAHQRKNRGITPTKTGDDEFPVLKRLGLYAASIKGDGNCLFRSLSDQYYGDNGQRYAEVRATVVQYMMDHAEFFEMFFGGAGIETWDSYIKRMARDGVYGDNLEIVAFARRYRANVVIYQNDFMYIVSCMDGQKDDANPPPREIHIAYHTWEHYSSVRNLAGPHSGDPKVSPSEPLAVESRESTGDDGMAPKWKIDIVKKSIPFASTPQIEDQIVRLLAEKKGDIGATVEVMLMTEIDGVGGGMEFDEQVMQENSVEKQTEDSMEVVVTRDEIVDNSLIDSESGAVKKKNGRPAKRITARERKERQKRDALERKKRKMADVVATTKRSESVPISSKSSMEDRSDESSYSTPGAISQYMASSELRAMYI